MLKRTSFAFSTSLEPAALALSKSPTIKLMKNPQETEK